MGTLLVSLLGILLVASVEHAAGAPTPEQYWKSALPDTPMPSSLSQLLTTSSASAGKHRKPRGTAVGMWAFHYFDHYDATKTHLQHMPDDPSAALFFLEKDVQMHTGRKRLTKVLHFMATSGAGQRFLPRIEADAVPFSSDEPDSPEAAEMARTLHVCEAPAAEGEKKWCATSLESMVDFATSSLGTSRVRAVSTVVGKEGTPRQEYALTGVKRAGADQLVVCHAEAYPYAVFACHLAQPTRAYTMSIFGEDGTAVEAVAVCHADTASWKPRHVAFQVLNVKPGTVPVCHFVPQDHVVWTRSLTFASYLDV